MTSAQCRLNGRQNRFSPHPLQQSRPKTSSLPANPARLPESEPSSSLGRQQTALATELPDPTASGATICLAALGAPVLRPLPVAQNRIQARLDDRRAVALERNTERRKQADRHPTAGTTTADLPDLNLLHLREPYIPEVRALAFRTRELADRTARRMLCLHLRIVWRVLLNRADEQRN